MEAESQKSAGSTSERLSRRWFIGAGSVTALAAAAGWVGREKLMDICLQRTDGDKIAGNFPAILPGAASVEKVLTPGSQKVLVHIRQFHEAPDKEMTPLHWEVVLACQRDIREILLALIENPSIRLHDVFDEGQSAETQRTFLPLLEKLIEEKKTLEQLQQELEQHQEKLTGFLQDHPDDAAAQALLRHVQEEMLTLQQEREVLSSKESAVLQLAQQGLITMLPAEMDHANEAAVAAAERGDLDATKKYNEQRENILVALAAKHDTVLTAVVYGANHDWRNNIDEWNAMHSDCRFSLIEITPETVKKYEGLIGKRI